MTGWWPFRRKRAEQPGELSTERPGDDDQFGTWPALRIPDKTLVVLCRSCLAEPVERVGYPVIGQFCAACVDRCHESTEHDHRCAVCSTSTTNATDNPERTST